MILADINPTADGMFNFLGCMAFLLGIAVAIKMLLPKKKETREISPQPLVIKSASECVTDQVCKERMLAVEREIEEIKSAKKEADASAKKDRKDLYDHVDKFRKELSNKIDDMPSQIVALLKNTNVIK